jgi:hypothetical protein
VEVETDGGGEDVRRGDVDGGIDVGQVGLQDREPLRRDEDGPDAQRRGQQATDDVHALGDQQLVTLDPAPRRRVAQVQVVGQPGIAGMADRLDAHRKSLPGCRRNERMYP